MKLMKLQFKNKLIADIILSTNLIIMIFLSRESTVIRILDVKASASLSSAILILFQDDIKNDY